MTTPLSSHAWTADLDEAGIAPLAGLLAADLRPGDCIALSGDLGAGKTTFARALLRALLDDETVEVPSPTFSLAQGYESRRLAVTHYDFYRLAGADEAREIGFDEALGSGAVLVEWPERAVAVLPSERLDIVLHEIDGGVRRRFAFRGLDGWAGRVQRLAALRAAIVASGWGEARVRPLAGDASARRYFRLHLDGQTRVVMDAPRQPDGPPIRDGKPYSRIAHLAEDVRPFVAVTRHLRSLGLSAPEIHLADLEAGVLVTEDLGDRVYGTELALGSDQLALWRQAASALHVVRRSPLPPGGLPVGDGTMHIVPAYDRAAMRMEVELLADWYVPAATGADLESGQRDAFRAAWDGVIDGVLALPTSLVLRDYHSPNLLVLADRPGDAAVGIIDVQDSLVGHPAYDLVSLLQDARVDVPEEIEQQVLADYLRLAGQEPGFDADAFRFAYAALGAQRNTKILGIFARLARRDGKPGYLRHIPRIWRYLERDLAHPGLARLAPWYDANVSPEVRARAITV